jgi:hypothetical protein
MPIIAIIVLGVVAVALLILEWRSWKKPLGRALEDTPRFASSARFPPSGHGELKKPHD